MNNKNILLVIGVVVLILLAVVSVKYSGNGQVGGALRGSDKSGSGVTLGKKVGNGSINQQNPNNPSALPPTLAYCPDVTGPDLCVVDLQWKTAPTLDANAFGNAPIGSATSSLIQNVVYFRMTIANLGTQDTEVPVGTIFHLYVDNPISPNIVGTWQPGFVDGVYQGNCATTNCALHGAPSKYNYNYQLQSIFLPAYDPSNPTANYQTIDFVSSKPTAPVSDVNGLQDNMTPAEFVTFVNSLGSNPHSFILHADETISVNSDPCDFIPLTLPLPMAPWSIGKGCVNEGVYTSTGVPQEPTNNFFQIPFTVI